MLDQPFEPFQRPHHDVAKRIRLFAIAADEYVAPDEQADTSQNDAELMRAGEVGYYKRSTHARDIAPHMVSLKPP